MARGQYAPQEVISAEVVGVKLKDETSGQRRNFNYTVRLNTIDVDTGEPIMVNEYRSIASNVELSNQTVLNRMISLIEENL